MLKPLAKKAAIRNDPDYDAWGDVVQFRLTYEGVLQGASRNDTRGTHKHEVRKAFHPQLKRLWNITKHLSSGRDPLPSKFVLTINNERPDLTLPSRSEALAKKYSYGGFRFVPLVTTDLSLICGIDVLFLRPDPPGELIRSGDIDNRLKTLFDSLRIPSPDEIDVCSPPTADEDPFYCLLQDDRLINQISVETDTLLQPTGEQWNDNDARLVITIKLRPQEITWANISFS